MNGLLHRVAARAAGTAVAVRSDAGLPYAGGGSGLGDVGEAEAQLQTAAADSSRVERVARTPPSLVDGPTHAAAVRDTPATSSSAEIALRFDSTPPSALDQPQSTPPPLQPAPLMPRLALAAIELAPEAAHTPREVAITARTAIRADAPAPLMPREPHPTPLAPVPQSANRRGALPQGSAATPSEADTEVHIHIGRIDVTAVHEAPAPRRRTAAAPAPMSLDGYLAQRGRS